MINFNAKQIGGAQPAQSDGKCGCGRPRKSEKYNGRFWEEVQELLHEKVRHLYYRSISARCSTSTFRTYQAYRLLFFGHNFDSDGRIDSCEEL